MGSTQDEKLERLQKGEARIVLRGQCSKLTFLVSCLGTSSGWHLLVLKAILLVLSAIHHLATNM